MKRRGVATHSFFAVTEPPLTLHAVHRLQDGPGVAVDGAELKFIFITDIVSTL